MKLVKISLMNGQQMILNMEQITTIRFYAPDDDGDCELVVNGQRKMGYVHGQAAADRILNTIFELGDKNSIALNTDGYEIVNDTDLWDV